MPTFLEFALASQRKVRKGRIPRSSVNLSSPIGLERIYQRQVVAIMRAIRAALKEFLIPQLPGLVDENKALNPTDRMDASTAQKVAELIKATSAAVDEQITERDIEAMATQIASQVDERNKASIGRAFKSAIGIDLFLDEPFVQKEIENFTRENVALIRATQQEFLQQTERTVFEGFRAGIRHEQIAQSILGNSKDYLERATRWTTAKNRAKVIARDQINKLNGQLNKLRQENAGINKWIWRDSDDDRVRDDHRTPNGHQFVYGKGTAVDGSGAQKPKGRLNPGEDIQ